MTPNPKNIGAAPEEYPIRALVHSGRRFRILTVGEIIQPGDVALDKQFDFEGSITGGIPTRLYGFKVEATHGNHYYRPTPSPDAVGVPEPQPKGPSLPEVTQPGEGVDLEAIEARLKEAGEGPWKSDAAWVMLSTLKAILADGPALIAEVRSLRSALEGLYDKGWTKEAIEAARVALRRVR